MRNRINKIFASRYWWLLLLAGLLVINYLAAVFHARFDLTKEKRYTLSKNTRNMLKDLDGEVQLDVFLKGEFPSGFKKLTNSVREFLRVLKESNSRNFDYRFISPKDEVPGAPGVLYGDSLKRLGAFPITLKAQVKQGESSSVAYPFALLRHKGRQELITLFSVPPVAMTNAELPEKTINSAEALLEYQFAKTLDKLTQEKRPAVVYATGNGEPTDAKVIDLEQTLIRDYRFGPYDIAANPIPEQADVLMIVKPTKQFTEEQKLKIDQFVMRGGKLLLFIDNLIAEQDSLRYTKGETIAYDRNLNLTDQLFRYGARINTDLVMDLDCDFMPFIVGGDAQNPQFEFLKWNYYPLFSSKGNHSINKNTGLVAGRFVNSIDTIATPGIQKTVLLSSSPNSRTISTPALISLNENKNVPQDVLFNKNAIPVALLLEGKFTSLYRNRASKSLLDSLAAKGSPFMEASREENKIIVVGDGDMVLNDMSPQEGPLPMGMNFYTVGSQYEYRFANKEFLLNCLEYLVNKPGIIETRNKDIVLRLLDSKKVQEQQSTWQFINIALPVLLVIITGWFYQAFRRRKYAA